MADEDLEHLKWQRLTLQNDRRRRGGFPPPRPDNPAAHAGLLLGGLERALQARDAEVPGFDDRALLKLDFHGIPHELRRLPGVEVVSEEPGRAVLVFADQRGRDEFENRLRLVQRGERATREELLFATKGIDAWTMVDRTAPALRAWLAETGSWTDGTARLDVELWPLSLDQPRKAEQMLRAFRAAAAEANVRVLDATVQPVVLLRVELTLEGLEWVLRHRDVRMVDRPPRFVLEPSLRTTPLAQLDVREAPPGAPRIGVLDSGIAANHPVLQRAAGVAESFISGLGPEDEHGHGTRVAGLAAYGDLETLVASKTLRATARLVSGRVLDASSEYDDALIGNQVTKAVEVLHTDYGCRVFNLSLGDALHPYDGGRLRSLAVTLDTLARTHDVVFVVSAGNFEGTATSPKDWRTEYPGYLLSADAGILDPAPAINVLTVGGLARHEVTPSATRNPRDPAYRSIAKHGEPSPFTRSGPIDGPIKPDLVAHAGNWGVDTRVANARPGTDTSLGVLSTQMGFVGRNLFDVGCGTSFAAPVIANLAARIIERYPRASSAFVRALLLVHADVPEATRVRLPLERDRIRLVGYGEPDARRVLASSEQAVTLYAEDELEENETHFYEVPLPEDFTSGLHRRRRIRAAVAHTPMVRPGRADYRASRLEFRLVRATSVAAVVAVYARGSKDASLPEYGGGSPGPERRQGGTVQAATWELQRISPEAAAKALVLVVTRVVPEWAADMAPREKYAAVIAIEDRERVGVRLHTQMKASLRARARVRPRR